MESYQNPIIIQEPERQPASIGLQSAALVLGIVGCVLSVICYFIAVFSNVMRVAAAYGDRSPSGGVIVIVLSVLTLILCSVVIILGAIGLVRSIRRPRTVKGIVFSAVGLCLGICGVTFALISIFFTGFFTVILHSVR